jgi:glycosyltransferase involved in cell wall biosynthesis
MNLHSLHSGPLRLLYVINGLGPGGAERSLADLLPAFLEAGVRPTVVCLRHRDVGVESSVRDAGCEIRFLPPGGLPSHVNALRGILRDAPVELVHTTIYEADVAGRLAAAGTGVPVLTSLVNTSYAAARLADPNVNRIGLWGTRMIDGWTARHLTTHFHAITHAVKDAAVDALRLPPDRITVVERGRDPERFGVPSPERRREARRRLSLPDNAEVVVNVGRQEYQKGQRYLLEAAAKLAETRPRLTVLISGREGHASRDLRALHEELHLGDAVRFLGHRDDVVEVLAAADLFAFPSIYEGLGGSVIEAMAMGLPIVAADIPALREVVEDGGNGTLTTPESPASLAGALARLLDDRELGRRFGSRSVDVFRERFTIDRSAARMIDLYHRVVAGATQVTAGAPLITGDRQVAANHE